jgi:hypothetical protein
MVPAFVRFAVLAGCILLVSPRAAGAQTGRLALGDAEQVRRDSLAVLSRARSEQALFEQWRFRQLPRTHARGSGKCDVHVGRFCFWFSDDADGDELPPEPRVIARRRGELLTALAEAAAALPGDRWIAGQHVRYLLQAGEVDAAVEAAGACRAEAWWCAALHGLALHESQRYADAEKAFQAALAAMPAEERERWMDVEVLFEPEDKRAWRQTPRAERERLARRIWWLADPLWSQPGNDRLTEHYARWTMDHVQRQARSVDRVSWANDVRVLLLRYGWSVAWERYDPLFYGSQQESHVIGYNHPRSWEFIPPLATALDPARLRGDEWPLSEPEPTATRYTPKYAGHILSLPHQMAAFPRPGGALVVAGYAVPHDSLPPDPRLHASLVAMDDAGGRRAESPWQPTAASGSMYVEVPGPGAIVSLELREDSTRAVARHRQAVDWDPDTRVSDLLLLAHHEARPTELLEAARIARGSAVVAPGERVGVFWEMYRVERGSDSMEVRVGLVPGRATWGRRRLEAIGLVKGARTARLGWTEGVEAGEVVGRSLSIGIPPDLSPGEYTLEVTVRPPGQPPATARRPITVRR